MLATHRAVNTTPSRNPAESISTTEARRRGGLSFSDYRGPRAAPVLRGLGWDYAIPCDYGDFARFLAWTNAHAPLFNCSEHRSRLFRAGVLVVRGRG